METYNSTRTEIPDVLTIQPLNNPTASYEDYEEYSYNEDVVTSQPLNGNVPNLQRNKKVHRQISQAEDCCFDCNFREEDGYLIYIFYRLFCRPVVQCLQGLGHCTDNCCEHCASILHNCCEPSQIINIDGCEDVGCREGVEVFCEELEAIGTAANCGDCVCSLLSN